jgi:hypothetical protein
MDTTQDRKQSLDALNSLLRGEISAVETYDQAIEKFRDDPIPVLLENRASHQDRLPALRERIAELGGTPDASSGMWGGFAKLVEGSAKLFGRDAAIAALEEGEDRGLADYRNALGRVEPVSRQLLETELLPAQERSHRRMSDLKNSSGPRRTGGRAPSPYATLLAAAVLLPLLGLAACHDERHVAITEVPDPARSAIVRHADGGQITSIEEDNDKGKISYHVKVEKDGKTNRYCVDDAGNIRD